MTTLYTRGAGRSTFQGAVDGAPAETRPTSFGDETDRCAPWSDIDEPGVVLPRVLVIDRNTVFQYGVRLALKGVCEVTAAFTVPLALQYLDLHRYALVVTAMEMPGGLRGLDIVRSIRRHPGYENVPVIGMTTLCSPEDRAYFLLWGFDEYLDKATAPRALRETVVRVLGTKPLPDAHDS